MAVHHAIVSARRDFVTDDIGQENLTNAILFVGLSILALRVIVKLVEH
jgi:hypothetical protein